MIKIIHQIYIQGYEAMNEHLQKYCMMWMRMYGKDWEYKFWSDEELLPFVKENYPDLYDIYKNLVPVKKSDLSRLLILHHYGGMYVDCDTIPIKRIDSLIEKYDNFGAIHCWETESDESWKKDIKQDFLKFNFPLNPTTENKIIGSDGSVKNIPDIPQFIKDRYKTAWELKQKNIIDMSVDRGKYICQSQSLNLEEYINIYTSSTLTSR